MGVGIGFSSSSADKSVSIFSHWKDDNSNTPKIYERVIKNLPNPKPDNYKIVKYEQIKDYLIVKIKYLDCTNYEGLKILVFKSTIEKLLKQKLIDPHFSENKKFISPIARFEPTKEGWNNSIKFVKTL